MERRGKSSPADWQLSGHVNPTRSKTKKGSIMRLLAEAPMVGRKEQSGDRLPR